MRVLANEERLETTLFQCAGKLANIDAVVSGEIESAHKHSNTSESPECLVLSGALITVPICTQEERRS